MHLLPLSAYNASARFSTIFPVEGGAVAVYFILTHQSIWSSMNSVAFSPDLVENAIGLIVSFENFLLASICNVQVSDSHANLE